MPFVQLPLGPLGVATAEFQFSIPMPKGKLRFMTSKEIKSLLKKSDRYRAYRYLDLRRAGQSRLLIRDELPYDLKHQINEEKLGPPTKKETLYYYDLDQHSFFESQRPEPTPESAPDAMLGEQTAVESAEEQEITSPAPPIKMPESSGPKFFIDLLPSVTKPTPTPQPLPEKGFLENDAP